MDSALDLMRRLPPQNVQENLSNLVDLCPEMTEELLSRVDQPLQVAHDTVAGRPFLLCDYNRDMDSYRSPWSNEYFPPLDDGDKPSEQLRALEEQANEVFNAYREQYYEGGISSVYLWELEGGFAGCFLVHKDGGKESTRRGLLEKGYWDAIHVVEAMNDADGKHATYKLTSTVMLHLATKLERGGDFDLGGSCTRQAEAHSPIGDSHLIQIGTMIEEMENKLRGVLDELYFQKTQEVVSKTRVASHGGMKMEQVNHMMAGLMNEAMLKKKIRNPPPPKQEAEEEG